MRGKKRVLPVESVPNGPKQKIKNNENRGPQSNYEIGWRRPGADKEGGWGNGEVHRGDSREKQWNPTRDMSKGNFEMRTDPESRLIN